MKSTSGEHVILFDIDGTLIDSGGAGGRALVRAAREHFGRPEIDRVPFHGRTDRGIMSEMLENAGIAATPEALASLSEHYFSILPNELRNSPGQVLPGVEALLAAMSSIEDCRLGLLTGNMAQSARIKLEHFALWHHFEFGIYGHAAVHRRELCNPAWEVIREVTDDLPKNVVVIGDTHMDVELALEMQVRCLAVCTGGFNPTVLTEAGAHCVLPDLSETDLVIRWLLDPRATES